MITERDCKRIIPGDIVYKLKGYPFPGPVRTCFKMPGGEWRLVVEFMNEQSEPTGLLHIFSPHQLALRFYADGVVCNQTGDLSTLITRSLDPKFDWKVVTEDGVQRPKLVPKEPAESGCNATTNLIEMAREAAQQARKALGVKVESASPAETIRWARDHLQWIRTIAVANYEGDPKLRSNGVRTLKRIADRIDAALKEKPLE